MRNRCTYRFVIYLALCVGLWACAGANREENKSADLKSVSEPSNNGSGKVNYDEQETSADSVSKEVDNSASPKDMEFFKESAIQKVKDLHGYIELISNKRYEKDFRNEVKDQALLLFAHPDSAEMIFPSDKTYHIKMEKFLSNGMGLTYDSISVSLDSITSSSFSLNGDSSSYSSVITYREAVYGYLEGKRSFSSNSLLHMDILVGNEGQQSGQRVWKISLGNVRAYLLDINNKRKPHD